MSAAMVVAAASANATSAADDAESSLDPMEVLEELELDYEEECNRAVEMRQELRAAQLEAQQLRLRLRAVQGPTHAGPTEMPAFSEEDARLELRVEELKRLFQWLAERIDLSQPPTIFTVGFEVAVAGRAIRLNRVAQWRVRSSSSSSSSSPAATVAEAKEQPACDAYGGLSEDLRLSVPEDLKDDIASMLASALVIGRHPHAAGATGLSKLSNCSVLPAPLSDKLRKFANAWDLIAGEVSTAACVDLAPTTRPEPAVLLAHQEAPNGILLATWPSPEAMRKFRMPESTIEQPLPSVGDRVEVLYGGEWYRGTLLLVDASGMAIVQCDVDSQGVWTPAPLSYVRLIASDDGAGLPDDVEVGPPTGDAE